MPTSARDARPSAAAPPRTPGRRCRRRRRRWQHPRPRSTSPARGGHALRASGAPAAPGGRRLAGASAMGRQELGPAAVQSSSFGRQQRLVDGLLQQGMTEAVGVIRVEGLDRQEQPLVDEQAEVAPTRSSSAPTRRARSSCSTSRPPTEATSSRRWVDSGRRSTRVSSTSLRETARAGRRIVAAAQQLLGEEGVAVGSSMDRRRARLPTDPRPGCGERSCRAQPVRAAPDRCARRRHHERSPPTTGAAGACA